MKIVMAVQDVVTIIASILIPMLGGFGWVISHLIKIDNRLTVLETVVNLKRGPGRPKKKEEV